MLRKGHRRIAYISPEITNSVTEDRASGYEQAFADVGLPVNKQMWCLPSLEMSEKGLSRSFIRTFFERNRDITAVFTVNIEMHEHALFALKLLGRSVPEEVDVITFDQPNEDGIPYVLQNVQKMCETAVGLIIDQINGERNVERCVIPVRLCFPD